MDTIFWKTVVYGLEKIIEMSEVRVRDYYVGTRYSGVLTDDGYLGVAYSYAAEERCVPEMKKRTVLTDFVDDLSSSCTIQRALGQAALNALGQKILQSTQGFGETGNLENQVMSKVPIGSTVLFVGSLRKTPDIYRDRGYRVLVFDRAQQGPGIMPDYYYYKHAGEAKVVYITGAAFSRPDIDVVLSKTVGANYVIAIGPSLSLPPSVLKETPITHVATSIVNSPIKVFELIKLGYGYHGFKEYLTHIVYRVT